MRERIFVPISGPSLSAGRRAWCHLGVMVGQIHLRAVAKATSVCTALQLSHSRALQRKLNATNPSFPGFPFWSSPGVSCPSSSFPPADSLALDFGLDPVDLVLRARTLGVSPCLAYNARMALPKVIAAAMPPLPVTGPACNAGIAGRHPRMPALQSSLPRMAAVLGPIPDGRDHSGLGGGTPIHYSGRPSLLSADHP